jgi:hypothetical protein
MVLLHAEQRCNVVRRIGAEIDSVASVVHKCEISISVNPLTVYIAELTVNTRSDMLFRGISSMRFQKTIAAFVATVGVSSSALGGNADNFPRLGIMMMGSPQNYDSTFQTYAAKVHLVVLGGGYEAWQTNHGLSKQTVTSSIKAQSKVNTRVFQFWTLDTSTQSPAGAGNPTYVNKVNSMNWWLRNPYPSGNIVPAWTGPDSTVNMVMNSATPLDPATGLGPYAWGAKLVNDMYHLGLYPATGTSAWPSLDGFMVDSLFWSPRVDGDWLRNGTTQLHTNSTIQLDVRTGEEYFFSELAAVFPSATAAGGNIADWYPGNGVNSAQPLAPGLGFFESAIGSSNSVDTWSGVAAVQSSVQFMMANLVGPKYLIFSHDGVTTTGSDSYGPNWQAMRYGITAALMNNGYYFAAATLGQLYLSDPANCLWFDEYSGGSLNTVGYLGQPLSNAAGAVQTAAWSNGVWKREFANGIVLWNPKGNGQQTISLSGLGNLKHFSGSQNPSLNNGATVTNGSVTLQDRDGLILMRLTPVAIPDPPTAVQIQ